MALQNSGEMSLDTVVTFYSLSSGEIDAETFYRSDSGAVRKTYNQINNTNQTANPTPINNQVPESGEFSFANLYGAERVRSTSTTFPGNTNPAPSTPGNYNPPASTPGNYNGNTPGNWNPTTPSDGAGGPPVFGDGSNNPSPGNYNPPTPGNWNPNPSTPGSLNPAASTPGNTNPTVNVSHEELF